MKYTILIPFLLLALFSCNTKPKSEAQKAIDDAQSLLDSLEVARRVDSIMDRSTTNVYWDTVGVSQAAIKVIKVYTTKRDYSNYKDIAITFKNVSDKSIDAIRFSWYGETAFGDPADMGTGLQRGFGGGFTDRTIKPGKTLTLEWSIMSGNARKNLKAWPTEIAFSDGTKWESTFKSNY